MNGAGLEVGAEVPGEVAGGAIVGGDDQHRARARSVRVIDQGGEQVGAERRRGIGLHGPLAGADRGAQGTDSLIRGGDLQQRSQAHLGLESPIRAPHHGTTN